MPRRAQPPTPPDLPAVPNDSRKKAYYPAGNKVYYCLRGSKEGYVILPQAKQLTFRQVANGGWGQ